MVLLLDMGLLLLTWEVPLTWVSYFWE